MTSEPKQSRANRRNFLKVAGLAGGGGCWVFHGVLLVGAIRAGLAEQDLR